MFNTYRSRDDDNLTLITNSEQFPSHFDEKNWDLEADKANVTEDIANEVTQFGFILMRSNLPIGHRTTYGLMS